MAQETLFQLLCRQPWWVTLLVAFAIFGVAQAVFPPVAPFIALPFAALAVYIFVRQWRTGPPANTNERLKEFREMSWEDFSGSVVEAYRRQGYEVTASRASAYDFELKKDGRVLLLQCRRWKVNQVGAAPVRELADAVGRAEAYKGICLAAGSSPSPPASSRETSRSASSRAPIWSRHSRSVESAGAGARNKSAPCFAVFLCRSRTTE